MNKPRSRTALTVAECKIQASILFKSFNSEDFETSHNAAKRFQRLEEFKDLSISSILQIDIKHKQALSVIAIEKGFQSWAALKCQLPFMQGGFLNQWFAHYEEAKSYQQTNGGFILPFKKHFFICDSHFINYIGLNANDPDWQAINYDWIHPENKTAWDRLYKKWMKIQREHHEK